VREETVIKVEKTPAEAETKQEREVITKKIVEEEVTVEVIPQESVHAEGIAFPLFIHVHEMVKEFLIH
jgi:hypothetical protein